MSISAKDMGVTEFFNPKDYNKPIHQVTILQFVDYSNLNIQLWHAEKKSSL